MKNDLKSKKVRWKNDLIFVPMNMEFDKSLRPREKNDDYIFLKDVFVNWNINEASTAFITEDMKSEDSIDSLIFLFYDRNVHGSYGFYKIYSKTYKDYIALISFTKRSKYSSFDIIEFVPFVKPEYVTENLEFWVKKMAFQMFEKRDAIIISSALKENKSSIKTLKKIGMKLRDSFTKTYSKKSKNIEIFVKFPYNIEVPNTFLNFRSLLSCNNLFYVCNAYNL